MKNWIYILYIGLLGCFTMACQSSPEEVQLPLGKVQIGFTLALGDLDSRSRAEDDWSEVETTTGVIGDSYENQIDLRNGLQVLVYSTKNNHYIGKVINPDVVRQQTENGRVYEFQGDLEIDLNYINQDQLSCRLMVFANCANVTDNNKETLAFSYDAAYIPMWGVQECTLTLTKGEVSRVPQTIYLLRAMAKVEVKLDAAIVNDFNLSSVSVDKYNMYGYVLPTYEIGSNTETLDIESVFNPNETEIGENLVFTKTADNEFYIYLPEYKNAGEDTTPTSISVVIDERPYTIEFKNYVSGSAHGEAYNIIRNHYYQYTITSVNTVENVLIAELLYQSMPWTDVDNGTLDFN